MGVTPPSCWDTETMTLAGMEDRRRRVGKPTEHQKWFTEKRTGRPKTETDFKKSSLLDYGFRSIRTSRTSCFIKGGP